MCRGQSTLQAHNSLSALLVSGSRSDDDLVPTTSGSSHQGSPESRGHNRLRAPDLQGLHLPEAEQAEPDQAAWLQVIVLVTGARLPLRGARATSTKKSSFGRMIACQGVSAISSFVLGSASPAQSSEALSQVCDDFQTVAVQLESMYPDLYKNVSSQMGINIGWEHDKITDAYTKFAHALIYKPGEMEPQISWVKIISLLCIGSALAVDCARNDKWNTIPKIIDTFDRVVTKILVRWIMDQNGWALPPELKSDQFSRTRRMVCLASSFLVMLTAIMLVLWHLH